MNADEIDTSVSPTSCPDPSVWEGYLHGDVQEPMAFELDKHLEVCMACNKTLEGFEGQSDPSCDLGDASAAFDESEEASLVAEAIAASKQSRNSLEEPMPVHTQIGPYQLLRPIATGGMGRVFLAEHSKLKRRFALKLLPRQYVPEGAVQRFEREIEAIGKLSHPAIVQATDAGADASTLYLAMEFVDGWDLSQILRMKRTLSVSETCEIGRQVALALSYAHHQGMVHRDIKPSNIMLDRTGNIKLLDFGLVLLDRWDSPLGELTTVGQFLGTLDYMAPEQAEKSAAVDHRSDLYSLGATLFRLLTGELPLAMLPNQSPLEKLRVLSQHTPVKLETLRHDLPSDLQTLIDSMLSSLPVNRPASAAIVAEKLQAFTAGADLARLGDELRSATVELDHGNLNASGLSTPGFETQEGQASGGELSARPMPLDANRKGAGSRGDWMWIATALLPFAIYAGVTLILEDRTGTLILESDLDDLEIKIIRTDATSERPWQVEQGINNTKLKSGEYELHIPAGSATVTPERVTLKQGEIVVAKVRREADATEVKAVPAPVASDLKQSEDEDLRRLLPEKYRNATFDGTTLLDLMKSIRDERERNKWFQSVDLVVQNFPQSQELGEFIKEQFEDRKDVWKSSWLAMAIRFPGGMVDSNVAEELARMSDGSVLAYLDTIFFRSQSALSSKSIASHPEMMRVYDARLRSMVGKKLVISEVVYGTLQTFLSENPVCYIDRYPNFAYYILAGLVSERELGKGRHPDAGNLRDRFELANTYLRSYSAEWQGLLANRIKQSHEQMNWNVYFDAIATAIKMSPPKNASPEVWETAIPQLEALISEWIESGNFIDPRPVYYCNVLNPDSKRLYWDISDARNRLAPNDAASETSPLGESSEGWVPIQENVLRILEAIPIEKRPRETLERLHQFLAGDDEPDEIPAVLLEMKLDEARLGDTFWRFNPSNASFDLFLKNANGEYQSMASESAEVYSRKINQRKVERLLNVDRDEPSYREYLKTMRDPASGLKTKKEVWMDENGGNSKLLSKSFLEAYRSLNDVDRSNADAGVLTALHKTALALNDDPSNMVGKEFGLRTGVVWSVTDRRQLADGELVRGHVEHEIEYVWEDGRWKINGVGYLNGDKEKVAFP